jgi:hypothetical protein
MKYANFVALAFVITILVPSICLAQEAEVGHWTSPFDGETLTGWNQFVDTAPFTVEDGAIVGRTVAGSRSSYLCSEAEYDDFELEFEVKCDTGLNSGFQIRTRPLTADDLPEEQQNRVGYIFGPQVEIESSPGQAGYIYGQSLGGWLSAVPQLRVEAARSHSHYKNDQWNHFRVIAKGPRIQTFVNGHAVADLTHAESYQSHPKGSVGLQVHMVGRNQGPYKVAWRNIRIRELKASVVDPPNQNGPAAYPYDASREIKLSDAFERLQASDTNRNVVQLTKGEGFCYPLYYFIPSITKDLKYLIYHRALDSSVQLHRLDMETGESVQLTHANVEDCVWIPWDRPSPGSGVLDHRSALNVAMNSVIYFTGKDGREVRIVDVLSLDDQPLFELPEGREAIGQNCCSPDGEWFVYIHAPQGIYKPNPCAGAVLAGFNLKTKEHRVLTTIDSAIHHVQPYGNRQYVFCHTPSGNGMMMATLDGDPWVHMRDSDPGATGRICHHITTTRGIAYEADGHIAGLYDPATQERFEFPLPEEWGYTHTGWDLEGRLWFWEAANDHHLEYLREFTPQGEPMFDKLTGEWPTYGRGQKSHFHPQLTPDRQWILFVAGDDKTESNHIFLLNASDLDDACE